MSEYIVRMPSDMPYEIKAELNAWYVNSEPIVRCRDCKHAHPVFWTERDDVPDDWTSFGAEPENLDWCEEEVAE